LADRKFQFGLVDARFTGSPSAVAGITSKRVEWVRDIGNFRGPVFFSHEKMLDLNLEVPKRFRFGLLVESETQARRLYRSIDKVMDEYSLVFTHSRRLLRLFQNARWIPGGGCWIGGAFGGGDQPAIFEKSKNISMVTSNKQASADHILRYKLARQIERKLPSVEVYRQLGGSMRSPIQLTTGRESVFLGPHILALEYLKEYRYSIVIENNRDDLYFTEKILNCFATGTVPIYRGARSISTLFDGRGIIPWSSPSRLVKSVLPNLNEQDYSGRAEAIDRNFQLFSRFKSIEDYIIENYGEQITGQDPYIAP